MITRKRGPIQESEYKKSPFEGGWPLTVTVSGRGG
jgi:hypothetical protein